MFADTSRTGKDHAHSGGGDIHAFIEDFAGDQHRLGAGPAGIEEFFAFVAVHARHFFFKLSVHKYG